MLDHEKILDKIFKSSLRFLSPLEIEETYSMVVTEALQLIDAQLGSLFIYKNKKLEKVFANETFLYKIKPKQSGNVYQVFKSDKPMLLNITQSSEIHPKLFENKVKSSLIYPIHYKNKTIAIISLHSTKKDMFDDNDLEAIKLFAAMASLAIRKAELNEESKKALAVRDIFINIAAHEFRTPLTSVSGYIQLLQQRMAGKESIEAKWVEQLSWECQRLVNLTDELLAMNRIKTGDLTFIWKECSVIEILKRVISYFEIAHPNRKVNFKNLIKDNEDRVIGDYDKLIQVFINLMDNAAKFSPIDSEIELRIQNISQDLVITIIDHGKGMTSDEVRQVFDGFYKAIDNMKTGVGLGLFLSKHIIQEHRGSLSLKSKVGQGTTAEVRLNNY